MINRIRIIKHEVTPDCGDYEVQIPVGQANISIGTRCRRGGSGKIYWSVSKLWTKLRLRRGR